MSTIRSIEDKCMVCGEVIKYHILGSTNTFGSPDLDGRPSEMARSTMGLWVHECPKCGYVSNRVSDIHIVGMEFLRTKEYIECDGHSFLSELAVRFYKQHKIALIEHDHKSAFFSLLHCAWACDDAEDEKNAIICRELAIKQLDELFISCDNGEDRTDLILMKADLLRRAEHFEELIENYKDYFIDNKVKSRILEFQIEKAKEKDSKCYRISDTDKDYRPPYVISL